MSANRIQYAVAMAVMMVGVIVLVTSLLGYKLCEPAYAAVAFGAAAAVYPYTPRIGWLREQLS
jgi:hypothetical protein